MMETDYWHLSHHERMKARYRVIASEFQYDKHLVEDVLTLCSFKTVGDFIEYLEEVDNDDDHRKEVCEDATKIRATIRHQKEVTAKQLEQIEQDRIVREIHRIEESTVRVTIMREELEMEIEHYHQISPMGHEMKQIARITQDLKELQLRGVTAIESIEKARQARAKLLTETAHLLKTSMCRMCKTARVSRVLLPCSHLSLCEVCVLTAIRCPCCEETILQTIKTFFSYLIVFLI